MKDKTKAELLTELDEANEMIKEQDEEIQELRDEISELENAQSEIEDIPDSELLQWFYEYNGIPTPIALVDEMKAEAFFSNFNKFTTEQFENFINTLPR